MFHESEHSSKTSHLLIMKIMKSCSLQEISFVSDTKIYSHFFILNKGNHIFLLKTFSQEISAIL